MLELTVIVSYLRTIIKMDMHAFGVFFLQFRDSSENTKI